MFSNTNAELVAKLKAYELDPLISDTACQTRAIYLANLNKRLQNGKPLKSGQESYLQACRILTDIKGTKRNQFGIITEERTDITKIPESVLAKNASNTVKNKFIAVQKKEVASKTLEFLIKKSKTLQFDDCLKIYTTSQNSFTLYSQKIPILPLYVSTKMMLNYAARKKIPLLVNLKRLTRVGEAKEAAELNGSKLLSYQVNETGCFVLSSSQINGPCIGIDVVTYQNARDDNAPNLFKTASFDEFLKEFISLDIATFIMAVAVAHPQYPATVKIDPTTEAISQKIIDTDEALDKVNLNTCSIKEYTQLKKLVNQLALSYERIYIDHIYASSSEKSQLNTPRR